SEEEIVELPHIFLATEAETVRLSDFHLVFRESSCDKRFAQEIGNRSFPMTAAATASAAVEELEPRHFRGLVHVVQNVFENRFPAEYVRSEYLVNDLPVHLFIFDRHLARNEHTDNGLAAAAPGAAGVPQLDIAPTGGCDMLLELLKHIESACSI